MSTILLLMMRLSSARTLLFVNSITLAIFVSPLALLTCLALAVRIRYANGSFGGRIRTSCGVSFFLSQRISISIDIQRGFFDSRCPKRAQIIRGLQTLFPRHEVHIVKFLAACLGKIEIQRLSHIDPLLTAAGALD